MSFLCPRCGRSMARCGFTPGGKQRWQCRDGGGDRTVCYKTTNPRSHNALKQDGSTRDPRKAPRFNRSLAGSNRFIVTAAQNATPVHSGFLKALETACNKLSAELIVVPIRYKNPTSRWTQSQANEEVWDPVLAPYLVNTRKRLNKNLMLLADVKTQPTAVSPLTGFEAITAGESCILAHTKLQLKTVATPQNRLPKILTSTGALTLPNYTDTKTGKIGEFHHSLSACLVETRGSEFQIRQLNADKSDGSFTDLDRTYSARGVSAADRLEAIILGDTHVDAVDPQVVVATDDMVRALKPKTIVYHDVNDDYAINPHHKGNVFNAIAKIRHDRDDARAEMVRALDFIEAHTPRTARAVVVPSNHNDFLTRWIINTDPRTVPSNARFWAETFLAMEATTVLDRSGTSYIEPFTYWGRKRFANDRVLFLDRDQSFMVRGIECGMHGDKGPNGARGSRINLRRVGVKSFIGHSHSPGIEEGCYQVGTSTRLRLEYNQGASSWLNTHGLIYASGKRTLVNIINGSWRLQ